MLISSAVHLTVLVTLFSLVVVRFKEGFWTSRKTGEDEHGEDIVETTFSFNRLKFTLMWLLLALASLLGLCNSLGLI